MAVTTDVQVACDDPGIPDNDDIQSWVSAAMEHGGGDRSGDVEVAVRIVDADEIQTLNRLYRDKDYATNVLSFPTGDVEGLPADAVAMKAASAQRTASPVFKISFIAKFPALVF